MLPYILFSIELSRQYAHGLMADIADDQLTAQPVPGQTINHPAWVLAHLCVSNDFGTTLLGGKGVCPSDWSQRFGMGAKPLPERSAYPSKAELLQVLDASTQQFVAQLKVATPAQLTKPMPENLRNFFPTVGDFVVFDFTSHWGTHLGQLSTWRRAWGKPPLF